MMRGMRAIEPGSIVGREDELAQMVGWLQADRSIVVTGEAGIGKTALVRAAAAATGRRLYEGGGFATLAWRPYLAIQRATGLTVSGDPEIVAARVERVVGPDVLLVDDLHWTDPATRSVVGLLVGRVALVVTIRDGDAAAAAALEPLRTGAVEVLRLGGIDDAAALELLRREQPGTPVTALLRIVDRAGGNPLLLSELASRGSSSTSLTRAILTQLEALASGEREALELLALADRPLGDDAVGGSGAPLLELGLVQREVDGLAVRHALIAEAIVAQIEPERRASLHGRLADVVGEPMERARHLTAAGRTTEAFGVATGALDAAADPRTRAALLTVAAETCSTDRSVWRVRAAIELRAIGSPDEAITLLQEPIDGDDDVRALAAAVLAGSLDHEGRSDEAMAVIEAARGLQPTPGGPGATEFAVIEGVILVNRGRLDDAIEIAERASEAAGEAAGGPRLAGHLAAVRLYAGRTERLDGLADAVRASLNAGDVGAAAGRAMDLYYMTLALGGAAAAVEVAANAASDLEAVGYHTRAAELRAESVQAEILAGHLADAVVHIDAMLEEPLGLLSRQRLGYNRGLALGLLGLFEDAERTFALFEPEATDSFDGRGALLWCWAEAVLWSGQPRRAADMAAGSLAYTAFNDAEFVLPSLVRAWAEVESGGRPSTSIANAPFRALAGAVPEMRALEAQSRGDHAAAATSFDDAAELWAGFHRPRELVCRWASAEARRRAGEADAVARLESVLADASAIGFEPLAARARRSLRLAGVHIAAPRGRGPMVELTAREAEVVTLVEQGLNNSEIARRLALGRPTVARMVTSAMGKLGVETRAQLAARAPV